MAALGWARHWGDKLEFYERLEASGRIVDRDRRPELGTDQSIMNCYLELTLNRPEGQASIRPIPITAIMDYARQVGQGDSFIDLMIAIDQAVRHG